MPSHLPVRLKGHLPVPRHGQRFALVFGFSPAVAILSALCPHFSPTARSPLRPEALGSEPVMLSDPSSLLRPHPPVSLTPADFPLGGYSAGLRSTRWSELSTRPSLLSLFISFQLPLSIRRRPS